MAFQGVVPFFLYLGLSAGLCLLFIFAYLRITAHDEIAQIRAGNVAAALSFGGNLIGFVLPLAKAVAQSASIPDCLLWAALAFVVQLAVYGIARLLVPGLSGEIDKGNVAAGVLLGATAIAGGLLNAAAMSL